ncbi:alkylated DNA nucleotide flippase Atl1 [Nonomuraea thailandensis]|uniref:Alkylated DNA nucleotide flippase Atl1 n=1 Tax=Nonomuraea thailandensis TaxID=1188745 RepID=A0A9X2GTM8_9ACTN|nr:MGMT family protein [Nonomuraea thailandensis]MCP2365309.1 alkylated DNA nucleotide flippase Atl1 [Nonomuraea thailandensis]
MSFAEHIAPILRTTLEVLHEAGRPLQPDEVRQAVTERISIAPEHQGPNAHGQTRWWAQLGFRTGEAASLGWMVKRNGWSITSAGIQALEDFPGVELYRELGRQYRARRLPAQGRKYADPRWNVVLKALEHLKPGSWTTYGDLAELVGMSAQSVGGFMAEAPEGYNAHRVLQAGGRISPQFRWLDPKRTEEPRTVLEQEGLTFDQAGRANPARRVTANDFRKVFIEAGVISGRTSGASSASLPDDIPPAFEQFQQNLGYARQLVHGGQNLERLRVGAFDVGDLYRAAWTQSVAALDHWITREIIDRAVALALQPGVARPPKFSKLSIPVELFEKVHHHDEPLDEAFRAHLEQTFAFMTFQNPDKIKEGFAHVSTVNLWVKVAEILTAQDAAAPITSDGVRSKLREIAWRRNNIAHTADHDPNQPGQKAAISAREAEETISWLESIAIAIQLALGDPLPATDYDAAPPEAGSIGAVPAMTNERSAAVSRGKSKWDEGSLLRALEQYCPEDVANTLLAVYRHAESHPSFRGYYFGEAEYPSATAWFSLGSDEAAVWSIYTGVRKSVLSINFEWMRNRGVSQGRLERLVNALSGFPGWAQVRGQLLAADYAKRPSLAADALAQPDASEVVIAALNDLLAVKARIVQILDPQPSTWYKNPKSTGARGGCSQHGTPPCHADIVASVVLADAGSGHIQWAVCQRGLQELEAKLSASH